MRFKVVLKPNDGDGYTIYTPSHPNCISGMLAEASVNIQEGMKLCLEPPEEY